MDVGPEQHFDPLQVAAEVLRVGVSKVVGKDKVIARFLQRGFRHIEKSELICPPATAKPLCDIGRN
jgi:hypothetical protein